VTNGGGVVAGANVTNVAVTCTPNKYTIGGTVTGMTGTGLVLQDNGGDDLTMNANGTFTFATSVASGSPYNVTILTQPNSGPTCVVQNGSGTVTNANVANVKIACTTVMYTINLDGSGVPSGWYQGSGASATHDSLNPNYYVGVSYRDYFVFNFGAIPTTATVTAVTLTAQNPCGSGGPGYSWLSYFFASDTPSITGLEATQGGATAGAIWTKLGSGVPLGSTIIGNPSANPETMNFSANGLASVQSALGTRFAIGTTYADGQPGGGFILGCSGGAPNSNVVNLTITTKQ
jgi:hypothetical protein